jgi:hypothetical protein
MRLFGLNKLGHCVTRLSCIAEGCESQGSAPHWRRGHPTGRPARPGPLW